MCVLPSVCECVCVPDYCAICLLKDFESDIMQVVSNNCSSYLNYPETSGETAVKGALPDSRMRTAAADAERL